MALSLVFKVHRLTFDDGRMVLSTSIGNKLVNCVGKHNGMNTEHKANFFFLINFVLVLITNYFT